VLAHFFAGAAAAVIGVARAEREADGLLGVEAEVEYSPFSASIRTRGRLCLKSSMSAVYLFLS
jgi:hypothetical protein